MCGIAGFAEAAQTESRRGSDADADFALVHRMCDVIRHRGPDDEGILVEPGVGLGMRRLSIIDLSTGHQPIHNEDGTVWVVFNGEIYNYRELRAELEARRPPLLHRERHRDHRPRLRAVGRRRVRPAARHVRHRALGSAAAARCSSRAIASGIKPLHYAERGGRLFFGSEIKSLLAAGAVDRELDPEALDHYLSFLYAPRDRSIFEGIRKLPPGHLLRWRDGRIRRHDGTGRSAPPRPFRGSADDAARRCGACSPTRSRRTWSATCRSARSSPAASTRASSSG